MCNYEQEKNENEVSKQYRECRGDLLDAVLNLDATLKEILAKVSRHALYNRFQLKEYEKSKIQDIVIVIDKCHFEFREDDSFIMDVPFSLYAKNKMRLETTFKDLEKNTEILHELSHIKEFLEESFKRIELSKIEEQAVLVNLLEGFDCLEKAFINFAKI